MKKIINIFIGMAFSMIISIPAFAGQWVSQSGNWFYLKDDSTYVKSGWFMDNDGAWYYFDKDGRMQKNKWIGNYYLGSSGAMLTSTTTPDGYLVGADGEYIDIRSDEMKDYMFTMTSWVLGNFYDYNPISTNFHKTRGSLTSEDKAFITYAYVYNKSDWRVSEQDFYNIVDKADLMSIMTELTGSSNESDMAAIVKYTSSQQGGKYVFYGSGDFGATPNAYPIFEGMNVSMDGNRVKISGSVVTYGSNYERVYAKTYTTYFTLSNSSTTGFLMFDELNVQ